MILSILDSNADKRKKLIYDLGFMIYDFTTLRKSILGTRHRPQPASCSLFKDSCFSPDGSNISNLMSGRGFLDFQLSYKTSTMF